MPYTLDRGGFYYRNSNFNPHGQLNTQQIEVKLINN